MIGFKSVWELMWDKSEDVGTFWLKMEHGGDGPIARLPSGEMVIFPYDPQPPYHVLAEFVVKKRTNKQIKSVCFLGKWTGKMQS